MIRRLLYILIVTIVTITIVACGDTSTGPDTDGDDDNGDSSEPTTYTVSVDMNPSDGGSISDLENSYEEGDEVEVEATPNDEYLFTEWTGDVESEDNPLSLTVDQDYNLTANFELKSYELTINKEGKGSISEEIVEEKSKEYEHGTVVELTANPAEGYKFVEWKGDIEGTDNPAQVTVDDPKEVTAVFEKKSYPLTINTGGDGAVSEEVIQQKTTDYEYGTVVELTANPAEGSKFTEWGGDLSGANNPVEITVEDTMEVTADFDKKTFSVSTSTTGKGTLKRTPDKEEYEYDSTIEITATPEKGWEFSGWGGDASGTDNSLSVTVTEDLKISATFEEEPTYKLTINTLGEGSVTKDPDQQEYQEGVEVELTANPNEGWDFLEWQGDLTGTQNPQQLAIDSDKEVTAVFEEEQAKFYVAENGVTIKCEDASVGETGKVDGVTYTKRSTDQITTDNAPTTCTSGIMDMSGLFEDANAFNGDISHWDVSSVTDMSNMFYNAGIFEGDVSNWDVSSVEDMSYMFSGANDFNGDLSSWNVSSVTNMSGIFARATSFNGDLSSWDVSAVKDMTAMFSGTSFNQNLNDWDVSAVTSMASMFRNVDTFDQDLSNWEVSNVVDMGGMFTSAESFNGDISGWDVSNVEDMSRMFYKALAFDQDLDSWDVSSVTNMKGMFRDAESFNGNVSNWDVSSVTDMANMFDSAVNFNADIGSWDVTGITETTGMYQMLYYTTSFNQNLNSWCVADIGEPYAFASGSELSDGQLPNWGEPCSGS